MRWAMTQVMTLSSRRKRYDKMVDLVLRRSHSAETVVARPSERGPESVPAGSHEEVVPEMRWAKTRVVTLSSRRKRAVCMSLLWSLSERESKVVLERRPRKDLDREFPHGQTSTPSSSSNTRNNDHLCPTKNYNPPQPTMNDTDRRYRQFEETAVRPSLTMSLSPHP